MSTSAWSFAMETVSGAKATPEPILDELPSSLRLIDDLYDSVLATESIVLSRTEHPVFKASQPTDSPEELAAIYQKPPTSLLSDLMETLRDEDPDCRTTGEVYDIVSALLQEVSERMSLPIPEGALYTDAAQGIRIQWDRGERHVVLAVPAGPERRRYIYAAWGSRSEAHPLSISRLTALLAWLARGA